MSTDVLKTAVIVMAGAALEHANENNAAQAKRIQQLEAELATRMKIESEAVSVMLWLYRRLPRCYGRPPHVEAPITALAKLAGCEIFFISESFAERNETTLTKDPPCGS